MSKDKYDLALEKIDDAKKNKYNLLIPSIPLEKPENSLFEPVLETLYVSTDIQNGKEIYPGSSSGTGKSKFQKYRLHASALRKVAIAGAVKWDSVQSGLMRDNGITTFRAVGGVLKADGDIYQEAGYYDLDLEVLKDDLKAQYEEKARDYDDKTEKEKRDYVTYCVNRDFRAKRQHQLKLCETGAKNRVIRSLFHVKSEYTMEELKNPFLVLRFKLRMDYQDPIVKQIIYSEQIKAALGVFGGATHPQLQAPIDAEFTTLNQLNPRDDDYLGDPEAPPFPEDDMSGMDSEEIDFTNSDKETQDSILFDLAKKTGTSLKKFKFPDNVEDKRLYAFRELKKKLKEIDDEIPF